MALVDWIFLGIVVVSLIFVRKNSGAAFDRDTTATLRGVAMFSIILSHIYNNSGNSGAILIRTMATAATGMFFFISGYGNFYSVNKDSTTGFKWLIRKLIKIVEPFIVGYAIYCILLLLFERELLPDIQRALREVATLTLPGGVQWFLKVIVLCFIIQWLFKMLLKNKTIQATMMTVACVAFIIVLWKLQVSSYWYTTILCYATGNVVALIGTDKLKSIIKNNVIYCITIILLAISFITCFMLAEKFYIMILCSILFSLLLYLLSWRFRTQKNPLMLVGNNSLEFYVFHHIWLDICKVFTDKGSWTFVVAVLIMSCLTVFLYCYITGLFAKKKEKSVA